jgi:hypothetical protein
MMEHEKPRVVPPEHLKEAIRHLRGIIVYFEEIGDDAAVIRYRRQLADLELQLAYQEQTARQER